MKNSDFDNYTEIVLVNYNIRMLILSLIVFMRLFAICLACKKFFLTRCNRYIYIYIWKLTSIIDTKSNQLMHEYTKIYFCYIIYICKVMKSVHVKTITTNGTFRPCSLLEIYDFWSQRIYHWSQTNLLLKDI